MNIKNKQKTEKKRKEKRKNWWHRLLTWSDAAGMKRVYRAVVLRCQHTKKTLNTKSIGYKVTMTILSKKMTTLSTKMTMQTNTDDAT